MKHKIHATFTVPIPNIYKKFNKVYEGLEKAGCGPWRAKTGGSNHSQLWFETEREDDVEKIRKLIPYKPKMYLTVDGIAILQKGTK